MLFSVKQGAVGRIDLKAVPHEPVYVILIGDPIDIL
jgi:hypothetical protein